MNSSISELFGYVCKHCKDPRATHERPGLEGKWGGCFIGSCNCPGYEQDNLLYLEQVEEAQKETEEMEFDKLLKRVEKSGVQVTIRTKSGDFLTGVISLKLTGVVNVSTQKTEAYIGYADIESLVIHHD